MTVLIISANTFPFSPSGPAYVAGAAQGAGHRVEVFDCFFLEDPIHELKEHISRLNPDVIGISIRSVAGKIVDDNAEFHTKPFDAQVLVKEIVDCIKRTSKAHVVLGGPGFNYYGQEWLDGISGFHGIARLRAF